MTSLGGAACWLVWPSDGRLERLAWLERAAGRLAPLRWPAAGWLLAGHDRPPVAWRVASVDLCARMDREWGRATGLADLTPSETTHGMVGPVCPLSASAPRLALMTVAINRNREAAETIANAA